MVAHLTYTPEKCLHCGNDHTPSQGFCFDCGGYTLPTRTHRTSGRSTAIQWEIFELRPSSSDAVKETLMRCATIAIEKNLYVAVFGYRLLDKEETTKTVVFIISLGKRSFLFARNDIAIDFLHLEQARENGTEYMRMNGSSLSTL
jgi:hypothetical protein